MKRDLVMSTNYFVENNRITSVMISKDCVLCQELQKNTKVFQKYNNFVKGIT